LDFHGRLIDLSIEADFTDGAGACVTGGAQAFDGFQMPGLNVPGVNAPGEGRFGIFLRDGLRDGPLFRDDGCGDHLDNACFAGILHDGVEPAVEFLRFEMAMHVNEFHGLCS